MNYLNDDPEAYGMELKNKNKGDPLNTAGIISGEHGYLDYIYADPEIFTEEARERFTELPEKARERFLIDLLEGFYKNNSEYAEFARNEVYTNPEKLLSFFQNIKPEDFRAAGVSLSSAEYKDRYKETQNRIEYAEEHIKEIEGKTKLTLKEIWPVLRIRDIFTESELAAFYYLQNPRTGENGEKSTAVIVRPDLITTPLDPVTRELYKISIKPDRHGSRFPINTTPHRSNAVETHINVVLYFDDDITNRFNLTKELTPFDKLIASAVYSIWEANHDPAGHCITTLTAIHNCISKSDPTTSQREKEHNSLIKQSLTRLSIDNREEAKKLKYPRFTRGSAALLEMREVEEVTTRNGKITEGYIEILAEPPAIAFSVNREQVTRIPAEVFKSGIPVKENNLTIQDYLIRRIAAKKRELRKALIEINKGYTKDRQRKVNEARQLVILTRTLFENTGRGKDSKDRTRALTTTMKYLKYYNSVTWIDGARLARDKTKITIQLPKNN